MLTKNFINIQKLSVLPYFTVEKASNIMGINKDSASVFCSRYAKRGIFVKLKNNFYSTSHKLDNLSVEEYLTIANILQVPSYVSLLTALSYYEISTQIQQKYIECISLKRTIEYNIRGSVFKFYKINKQYYSDFTRTGTYFIATAEKSFLDAVYLYSFGKYRIDFSSLDLDKLNIARLKKISKLYPKKTRKIIDKYV